MRRWLAVSLLGVLQLAAQQAPIPSATELPGRPFAIQNKWIIGGTGNWETLTLDPASRQLFITHQTAVQVVDVETGALAGEITGFQEARAVVLDSSGQFGYVSDGRAQRIRVFDRRTLAAQADISLACSPRSMVLAAEEQVLFAFCGSGIAPQSVINPRARNAAAPNLAFSGMTGPQAQRPASGDSQIAVIDTETRNVLAYIAVPGDFRIAQPDGLGHVYVTVGAMEKILDARTGARKLLPQRVAEVDATVIGTEARREYQEQNPATRHGSAARDPVPARWETQDNGGKGVRFLPLPTACQGPQGLAADGAHMRLFVACDNQALAVINASSGDVVTTLTTGPGTDAVAWDAGRGLIFAANGGGYGSVTIIRRDVTDTYNVIQNLPTMERARTLALDPSTGLVYLVTELRGAKLARPPMNGIGTLKLDPVDGSFQVLVIGN